MTWTNGGLFNTPLGSPFRINDGTVVIKGSTLLTSQNITNGGTLQYAAPVGSATFSGVISGAGAWNVSAGSLTLSSGANTFSGNITLSGGTLIAGGFDSVTNGPLGTNGTISFSGGTLGWNVNNNFDYSPRFDPSAGQAYKFDTGGQLVTLANNLASSGGTLTKLGAGGITLSGTSSYGGLTTVGAGKLIFQGSKTGTGNITVSNSAVLGVTETGTQVTPATLALGTSSGASLEVYNVSDTSTAPLSAGTLTSGGTLTVNIIGGTFTAGQSYPLLHWNSGSAPSVTLGITVGAVGTLSIVTNTVKFTVSEVALIWDGATSGSWDISTANNWLLSGSPTTYADPKNVAFSDAATGQTNVTISGALQPGSSTVYNNSKIYSITSSVGNNITGANGLNKGGIGTLTLSGGANAYTGVTAFLGGAVNASTLTDGGVASDIGSAGGGAANQVFNGGALQYTGGGASINRLFTLATGGGTISALGTGTLTLNNSGAAALTGTGDRVLTLAGTNTNDNTLTVTLGDQGGTTALVKSGSGKWDVTGNNTNSGVTTIINGVLQVGAGPNGSLGSGNIINNAVLVFNRTGTLTNSGAISGSGSVTNVGSGTVILAGDNTYTGGTGIGAGSTLQIGNGGATGSLDSGSPIVDNGMFIINTAGLFSYLGNGLISGTGNVIVRGSGVQKFIGNNTYTGWTLIDPGATFQPCEGNQGALVSSVVTNNGTLKLVRQDTGAFTYAGNIVGSGQVVRDVNNFLAADVTLTGNNTYTGGTIIQGGELIIGNGTTVGSIIGNVLFTNSVIADDVRTLTFNHSDNVTFPGNITYSTNLAYGNRGIVKQGGGGTLTLTGTNDYPGGTTISAGILQVGNGGTSGAIGTGPVDDESLLIFNRSDDMTFGGVISGNGSVYKLGAGTLTLTATNTYFGSLVVSNGTVLINGQDYAASIYVAGGTLGGTGAVFGPVTLDAGTTFAPADSVGTFTINSDLTIGGNVAVQVDKSLARTNAVVTGALSKTGTGTLTVANLGPALAVNDTFYLFSGPVANGAALTVTGAGATWTNNLADNGSITVLTAPPAVNANPPVMHVSVSGTTLSLAWPTNLGWTLLTNSVGLTATNQWFPYSGSASITNVNITINPGKTNVFFRMVYPYP
jgi:autotransporter-associated beta strand protein